MAERVPITFYCHLLLVGDEEGVELSLANEGNLPFLNNYIRIVKILKKRSIYQTGEIEE